MKIAFTNNYDMAKAMKKVNQGSYPGHHLWGIKALAQRGHEIHPTRFREDSRWSRYRRKSPWGDLDQQAQLWADQKSDVVFSGSMEPIRSLCRLRTLRLFSRPIVAVVHHHLGQAGFRERIGNRLVLEGADRFVCISRCVERRLVETCGISQDRVHHLVWGPDLEFYGTPSPPGEGIVAAGKTGRDYDTLCRALETLNLSTRIVCSGASAPTDPGPRVEVTSGSRNFNALDDHELLPVYRAARVVAIPLQPLPVMLGLTSLLDAMAMARPVVMTRNEFIDLDIEAEGIGRWVAPGDVHGWREALAAVHRDPEEAARMGLRGRALCESSLSLDRFSARLEEILASVAKG